MNQPDYASTLLERITPQKILTFFAFWILGFAGVFYLFANSSEEAMLYAGKPTKSFLDALYLSTITATTLGYGDITPTGWARLFACFEVIGGLVLGGLAVSTLTSVPLQKARRAYKDGTGIWVDLAEIQDENGKPSNIIITITTIKQEGAMLMISGENFDTKMNSLGTYSGHLFANNFPEMIFYYRNETPATEYTEGVFRLTYEENNKKQIHMYKGFTYDAKHGCRDRITGYKVTDPVSIGRLHDSVRIRRAEELKRIAEKFFADILRPNESQIQMQVRRIP